MVAGAIAADPDSQVLSMVAYAWAGLGASIGPAVLACLYWRRTTEAGLVAGMLLGAATTVLWRELSGGVFDLYEIVPAFAAALLGIGVCGWRADARGDESAAAIFDRLAKQRGADISRSCSAAD